MSELNWNGIQTEMHADTRELNIQRGVPGELTFQLNFGYILSSPCLQIKIQLLTCAAVNQILFDFHVHLSFSHRVGNIVARAF